MAGPQPKMTHQTEHSNSQYPTGSKSEPMPKNESNYLSLTKAYMKATANLSFDERLAMLERLKSDATKQKAQGVQPSIQKVQEVLNNSLALREINFPTNVNVTMRYHKTEGFMLQALPNVEGYSALAGEHQDVGIHRPATRLYNWCMHVLVGFLISFVRSRYLGHYKELAWNRRHELGSIATDAARDRIHWEADALCVVLGLLWVLLGRKIRN